jgi:hypothetical protein
LFSSIRGLFSSIRGLFSSIRGLFLTIRGLFLTIRGLFSSIRGFVRLVGIATLRLLESARSFAERVRLGGVRTRGEHVTRRTVPRRILFAVAAIVSAAIAFAPTSNTVDLNRDDRPWLARTGGPPPED